MAQVLNNSVFPIHKTTFQGIATDELLSDKPYKIIHADDDSDLTITWADNTTLDITLIATEDISVTQATKITSTASIKIS